MATSFGVGQYWRGDSFMHRLDPRTKVLLAFALMVSVFFILNPAQLMASFACIVVLALASQLPPRRLARSVAPFAAMLGVLALINLVLVQGGTLYWSWSFLAISSYGLRVAVLYSLRMLLALVVAAVLLATTTQTQLTDALDSLLGPLARVGLPGHELAMMFSLMLRFIPTLADETHAILDAQTMRGASLGEGSPARRMRALVPVMVALFASSLRHADGIARALDARCYEPGSPRSHWHPLKPTWRDPVAVLAFVLWCLTLALLATVR